MKLKKLIATGNGRSSSNVPVITINHKGRIGFNAPALQLMQLSVGNGVSFFEDEEDAGVWYITKDEEGTILRSSSNNKCFFIQSQPIAHHLMKAHNFPIKGSAKFLLAGKPTVFQKQHYYGIIAKPV